MSLDPIKKEIAEILAKIDDVNFLSDLRQSLSDKFRSKEKDIEKFVNAKKKIGVHLEQVKCSIDAAVNVSEKTGVPFKLDILDLPERQYMPETFKKGSLSLTEISEILGFWPLTDPPSGWEFWRTSKLDCEW